MICSVCGGRTDYGVAEWEQSILDEVASDYLLNTRRKPVSDYQLEAVDCCCEMDVLSRSYYRANHNKTKANARHFGFPSL